MYFKSLLCTGCLLLTSTLIQAQPAQQHQLMVFESQQAFARSIVTSQFSNGISFDGWFRFERLANWTEVLGFGPLTDPGLPTDYGRTHGIQIKAGRLGFTGGTGNSVNIEATAQLPLDTWLHLAVTYDNQTVRLFQNGVVVAEQSASGVLSGMGSSFFLGHQFQRGFQGQIRALHIWKRGLDTAAVQSLFDGSVNSNDLVASWQLNESSGSFVADSIGGKLLYLGDSQSGEMPAFKPSWQFTSPFFELREDLIDDTGAPGAGINVGTISSWGLADFNNDGFMDFVYNGPEGFTYFVDVPLKIFLNDKQGGFVDSTSTIISGEIPGEQTSRSLVTADFNGDNIPDIYLADHGLDAPPFPGDADNLLLSNAATGKLELRPDKIKGHPCRLTAPAFAGQSPCDEDNFNYLYPDTSVIEVLDPVSFTHSVTAADIDNDGDIDIYAGNIGSAEQLPISYFLINDGSGNFMIDWQGVPEEAWSFSFEQRSKTSSLLVDLDKDGFVDLFLGSNGDKGTVHGGDSGISYMIWGDGSGSFKNKTTFSFPKIPQFPQVPTAPIVTDIDGDQDLDIIVTYTGNEYIGRYIQILENRGNRQFVDVTQSAIPTQDTTQSWIIAATAIELDGNNCPDLLFSVEVHSTAHTNSSAWLNDCHGRFTALPDATFGKNGFLFPLDSDNDGDLDFVTGRRVLRVLGSDPSYQAMDFAVLKNIRPLNLDEIFDTTACNFICSNQSVLEFLSNKSRFLPATGEIHIPALQIGSDFYYVVLTQFPNASSLDFKVDLTKSRLLGYSASKNVATFDGTALTIPHLELGAGSAAHYRAVLNLTAAESLLFTLVSAE